MGPQCTASRNSEKGLGAAEQKSFLLLAVQFQCLDIGRVALVPIEENPRSDNGQPSPTIKPIANIARVPSKPPSPEMSEARTAERLATTRIRAKTRGGEILLDGTGERRAAFL